MLYVYMSVGGWVQNPYIKMFVSCVSVHTLTQIFICKHTQAHTFIHAHTYTHAHMRTYTHIKIDYTCTHTHK